MTAEAGAASPERCAVPGCGRDPETHDREVYIAPLGHDFTPPERLDAIIAAARAALAPASPDPERPCPDGDSCPDARRYGSVHPAPAAAPEPERCEYRNKFGDPVCVLPPGHPNGHTSVHPAPAAPTVEALRDALLSEYADDQHAADLLLDRLIELEAAVRADERTRLP